MPWKRRGVKLGRASSNTAGQVLQQGKFELSRASLTAGQVWARQGKFGFHAICGPSWRGVSRAGSTSHTFWICRNLKTRGKYDSGGLGLASCSVGIWEEQKFELFLAIWYSVCPTRFWSRFLSKLVVRTSVTFDYTQCMLPPRPQLQSITPLKA